jgi:ribosomal protein S18 acetylase RimI-like enzyme
MTPFGLRIRVGTADACAEVLALWTASGAASTVTDSVVALLRLLETDDEALLVAEIDGVLVGSVIAGWNGWRGSLYRLTVRPGQRRRGVATALVLAAERQLRTRGALRIDAIVDDEDAGAARFWAAAGYCRQQHRGRFVRNL